MQSLLDCVFSFRSLQRILGCSSETLQKLESRLPLALRAVACTACIRRLRTRRRLLGAPSNRRRLLSEGRLRRFQSVVGEAALELHKIGGAPLRFRLRFARTGLGAALPAAAIETIRLSGERQLFHMQSRGRYRESVEDIPKPHDFKEIIRIRQAGSVYEHEIEYN